ncbi:MAG: hypothetical protein ABI396_04880, partial [Ktedonobacteraceae bacterium]
MIEELINKYQVPRQLAHVWVETDLILPLLDGLDEVATENRTKCIEAINTYHQEHAFLPLVVSSRSADYLQQTGRVRLTSAVTIQSLTQQQVDDYLARGGESLWALRVAFHQDAALRELAETPLMLSILTLTYHDMPVEDLLRGGIAPTRQQVFEHYVERMVERRGEKVKYRPEQTRNWLAWLARKMKGQSQTVFYLEHLPPDWLSEHRLLQVYNRWAVRLPGIFIGSLVFLVVAMFINSFDLSLSLVLQVLLAGGFIGWILSERGRIHYPKEAEGKTTNRRWHFLVQLLGAGGLIGFGIGLSDWPGRELYYRLFDGFIFGLSSILILAILKRENAKVSAFLIPPISQGKKFWHFIERTGVRTGILVGLLYGGSSGLTAIGDLYYGLMNNTGYMGVGGPANDILSILFTGFWVMFHFGLIFGLSGALLTVLLATDFVHLSPTDKLVWSKKSLAQSLFSMRHIITALVIIPLAGVLVGLIEGAIIDLNFGLSTGLSKGVSIGMGYWLLLGFFRGVSSEMIEDQHRLLPNQGFRHSARNALIFGFVSTGVAILAVVLSVYLSIEVYQWGISNVTPTVDVGLNSILSFALLIGLIAGLLNGGLFCFRYFVLCVVLWQVGLIPWNYPRFLDYAAERILLRKVGGGYIFVHRLLLEYFASLDTTSTPDVTRP